MTLRLPARRESVTVTTQSPGVYAPLAGTQHKVDDSDQARSLNTAELLGNLPGVSLRDNGELATIPLLHGLGDERTKVVVNGMTVSASCPNHMNPPLSYIDPSNVAEVNVMAGITPVSMGGDSIGGTILRRLASAGLRPTRRTRAHGRRHFHLLPQQWPKLRSLASGLGRHPEFQLRV